jgi:hypothetical protein
MMREREYVKGVYPNARWAAKVDRMPDDQVLAIYFRFRSVVQMVEDTMDESDVSDRQLRLFP